MATYTCTYPVRTIPLCLLLLCLISLPKSNVHTLRLHSFPTRRSSDLPARPPWWNTASGCPPRSTTGRCTSTSSRSEEHTSELQSPCNLVCRLLLEKKN